MRIISGGKDDSGDPLNVPDDASATLQAKAQADSVFLRATYMLETARKGRIWFDDFYGDFFTDWDGTSSDVVIPSRRIEDAFYLRAFEWLQMQDTRLAKSGKANARDAVQRVADDDHRNEPREWIRGLQWDGVERLPTLLSVVYGTPNDEYNRAVGRCWFVSMVARIMEMGCKVDTMPVFCGEQGTSKSTALEIIGGKWHRDINTKASDGKDFFINLRGVLVAEIQELDAFLRSDDSQIKAILSTRKDVYRPPYGHAEREFPRSCVFAGTVNVPGWHRDYTGGRRFWPVHCGGDINLAWLRENRDQLFAEALARYERGEKWWDVPGDMQAAMLAEHYTADPWEERIERWLESNAGRLYTGPRCGVAPIKGDPSAAEEAEHWGTLITTNRLLIEACKVDPSRLTKRESIRATQVMTRLAWKSAPVKVKFGGKWKNERAWIATQLSESLSGNEKPKLL
jgi:predicted P-loop ATPase